jgi:cysteine-rich repeat protein
MTRWSVIAIGLVISACEHGETPPPSCGDRVVDFGEQCDDGNDIADDGCDQCVAMSCGNSRIDEFEECDDGNVLPGDGCAADCQVENSNLGRLDMFWVFQDLDLTVTGCPVGFGLIEIAAVGQQTGTQTQLFDCLPGSASLLLPLDLYTVTATSKSFDLDVFATSLPQTIDLRAGIGAFSTTLFNDGGVFEVAWQLVGDLSNNVVNCMQANVKTLEIATSPNGTINSRSCLDGRGFTTAIPEGTYTISLTASDAQSTPIATSTPLPGQPITVPNGRTNVGLIPIRIPGM